MCGVIGASRCVIGSHKIQTCDAKQSCADRNGFCFPSFLKEVWNALCAGNHRLGFLWKGGVMVIVSLHSVTGHFLKCIFCSALHSHTQLSLVSTEASNSLQSFANDSLSCFPKNQCSYRLEHVSSIHRTKLK